MRFTIPALLLFLTACHMNAEDPKLQEIEALAAKLVKLGYPDCAGAEITCGKATVNATVHGDEEPPFSTRLSKSQMTSQDGGTIYSFEFNGMHVHLADGTWLLGLRYRSKNDKLVIKIDDAKAIDPATLTASAAQENPYKVEQGAKFLEQIPEDQRAMVDKTLQITVPVSFKLKLRPDDMPLATIVLALNGWKDAAWSAQSVAVIRSRDYWQQQYWSGKLPSFDPTGEYKDRDHVVTEWRSAHPKPQIESAEVGLRRALHREFRMWLAQPDPAWALDAKQTKAAAIAMLDPADPQKITARIEALYEAQTIPKNPPADAPLAEKLRSWSATTGTPEFRVKSAKDGTSMSTTFSDTQPAYVPAEQDIAELVKLVKDDRTSRLVDFSGARTVGDNALRALAVVLQRDPRSEASMADMEPWTSERRHQTAQALEKWLKTRSAENKK
jgi:hypothetical protein